MEAFTLILADRPACAAAAQEGAGGGAAAITASAGTAVASTPALVYGLQTGKQLAEAAAKAEEEAQLHAEMLQPRTSRNLHGTVRTETLQQVAEIKK